MHRSALTLAAASVVLCVSAPVARASVSLPPTADAAVSAYLAPLGACPGQTALTAPPATQLAAMRCLVNWARRQRGVSALRQAWRLDHAARLRAAEIRRCNQFSHTPCGDSFLHVFYAAGYLRGGGSVAENLAWGSNALGSARAAVASWLASPPHRANLFARAWRDLGVAYVKANLLFGVPTVTVWVAQFGRRG